MVSIVGFKTVKSSAEFNHLYKSSPSKHSSEFVVFYNPKKENKVGFVAGKKVGNAVARNRAKRLLRAHFIELSSQLNNGTYLFIAKPKLLESSYKTRDYSLQSALKKLNALQIKV